MNQQNSNQYYPESTQYTSWVSDNPGDNVYIFIISDIQPLVDFTKDDILLFSAIRFEDQRTHHRTKRQSHYCRYQYRDSDSYSKLTVELSRNTTQKAHGHKHRTKHQ